MLITINHKNYSTTTATKNENISLILTFLFGPLGILYSSISGALTMFFVVLAVDLYAIFIGITHSWSLGIIVSVLGVVLTRPICMIWGYNTTQGYNRTLLDDV